MEKQLTRKVSFESSHHGCIMSIFSLFASHQRHLRKLLSEREHAEGMHAGCTNSQKTNIIASTPYKAQEFISPEIDCCTIEGSKVKVTRKKRKMFTKARIKAFIAGETRRKHTPSLKTLPVSSRLQRLYSIHHMEYEDSDFSDERPSNPSDNSSTCSSHESLPPIHSEQLTNCCKRCEACGALKTKNLVEESKIEELGRQLLEKQVVLQEMLNEVRESLLKPQFCENKDIPREVWQSRKIVDALEVVNSNRDLFLKILKDLDDPLLGHFQSLFRKNAVLTKSGTYPGTKFSEAKNTSPSKLSQIHTGIPSPYIQDRINTVTGQTKLQFGHHPLGGTSAKDDDTIVQGMPPASKKNRFQDMKTKIKQAFKENQKEHLRISLDAVLDKVPSGRNSPDAYRLALERERQDSPMSSISYGSEGPRRGHIKRRVSVTESIERYSQLFESISQKESIIERSDTLKVSDSVNENRILSDRRLQLKAFGRNRSLPDIPFYLLDRDLEDEASLNVYGSRTLHSTLVDTTTYVDSHGQNISTEDCLPINISGETQNSEGNLRTDIASEEPLVLEVMATQQVPTICNGDNSDNLTVEEPAEIQTDISTSTMLEFSEVSDQSSCQEEDTSVAAESCITEDIEIKTGNNGFFETEVILDAENQLSVDEPESLTNQTVIKEAQSAAREFYNYVDSLNFQVDARDEADFSYVRNVLQKSGFSGDELLRTWHSPDQPVDPSLFDEVEEESPSKLEGQQYELVGGYACSDHLLLFDLTNEVLLEIYEKTFSPCPWFGSFSAQARPMPVGYHVLEEVWGRISWHLNLRPQLDTSLDHVVARDFTKGDGWMDLQMDTEDLGLELEEWILDDLLDELVDELFA